MPAKTLKGRKVVVWVHSGGADPMTGLPSYASEQRMFAAEAMLKSEVKKGDKVVVFFSGEPTRKSGGHDQASVLEKWFAQRGHKWEVEVANHDMMTAYAILWQRHHDAGHIIFVNDNVYMGFYEWKFAKRNMDLAAKIKPVALQVTTDKAYLDEHALPFMACYACASWLREVMKTVGPVQFMLFLVDRAVNKPTQNPLKRLVAKVAGALLRKDLR